ncbi:glycosyltransferase [Azospirillum sp. RWY-5-1]|uniref:Glycosyltransferase n=1 Tax=Azospirillum oleiclasticum TaxID=2735135 RepID=A0ABX2T570_9PROT|nr:glycosyltransferase [Azospirillum oleiclasticum]NYZ12295.1 glycosyltransferase [Azospirillum oleiclasticum]NYZ19455.1 glycosyltransferase [Azospirillum oleiclasticum]
MHDPIDVSVAVCTHRRPALLAACLASLEGQDNPFGRRDILVIDNDPDRGAEPVTRAAAPAFRRRGVELRYEHEPRPGVAHARNRSLVAARHPIIAYIDDDERAAPGWLARLIAPFHEQGEAIDIVAGEVEPDFADVEPPDWLTGDVVQLLSCRWRWSDQPRLLRPQEWFGEGNCAFRRALLADRGFNPALGRRAESLMTNEGIVFSKLRQEGATAWWEPRAVTFHHVHPERLTRRWMLRRQFYQGYSDVIANREIGRDYQIPSVPMDLQALGALDVEGMPNTDFPSLLKVYYVAGYAFGRHML